MSNFIKGVNGVVFIYDTVGMAWRPTACLTSVSFDSTVSTIESNTKCAPGVIEKDYGTISYSLALDGQYIDTTTVGGDTTKMSHDAIWNLQASKTKVLWKLDTDITNVDSVKYYGKAIISEVPLTMGSGDELSTFTATLDVDGAVTHADPALIPVFTNATNIPVTIGTAGTFQLVATNSPTTYAVLNGTLPTGMTLAPSTGLLTWTTGVTGVGVVNVTFSATNASGTGTKAMTITKS